MRSILIAVMLLAAIIVLYESTIGGEQGSREKVQQRGREINVEIERIDP